MIQGLLRKSNCLREELHNLRCLTQIKAEERGQKHRELLRAEVQYQHTDTHKGAFKGALCRFGETNSISKLSLFSWLNKQMDLKGQHNFILFYFVFGGHCHLSCFRQCSGDLICLWEQLVHLVYLVWIIISLMLFNIKILSVNLFSKTTYCTFKVGLDVIIRAFF